MDECIDRLGASIVFSTLNTNTGDRKIKIDVSDLGKTAFTSHHDLYKFTRMSFELKTSSKPFQRPMDVILSSRQWYHTFVYLKDLVVFCKSRMDHIEHD